MIEILKSEILCYRKWVLGLGGVHLMGLLLIMSLTPVGEPSVLLAANYADALRNLIFSLLIGALFGLFQMGLHKRKNHWTYLLHRPVASPKIYLALAGGALVCCAVVFLLPWLFALLLLSGTDAVIDGRHWLHGFYLLGLAYCGYLSGSFIQLSANKAALLVLFILNFVIGHAAFLAGHAPSYTPVVMAVFALVIAWLFFLNLKAFQPDLKLQTKSEPALFLTAFGMQMALLLLIPNIIFIPYAIFQQKSKDQLAEARGRDSYANFARLPLAEKISYLLDLQPSSEAEYLKTQAPLATAGFHSARPVNYSVRGQLFHFDVQGGYLSDGETETFWVFSHRQMLFKGYRILTGEPVGWMGVTGFKTQAAAFSAAERFPEVPVLVKAHHVLQLSQVLLQINFKAQTVQEKHRLTGSERYYGRLISNNTGVSIASTQKLYIFSQEDFVHGTNPLDAQYVVPHPLPVNHISRIETLQLIDGFLLVYSNDYLLGGGRPGATLLRTRLNGDCRQLVLHEFTGHEYPAFFRYQRWAVSPLLTSFVEEMIWRAIEPRERSHLRFRLNDLKLPSSLRMLLILMGVLSALLTLIHIRKSSLSMVSKWVWPIVNGFVGLPGLLSYYLLMRHR